MACSAYHNREQRCGLSAFLLRPAVAVVITDEVDLAAADAAVRLILFK